jgi:hypothetical protein
MKRDTQQNNTQLNGSVVALSAVCADCRKQIQYAECHYAECRHAEGRGAIFYQHQNLLFNSYNFNSQKNIFVCSEFL